MIANIAQDVLDFWFSQPSQSWFIQDDNFDHIIRERFSDIHYQACLGHYDDWCNNRYACLALIIIFDQFSRHLYRGTANAFSQDDKALALANHALQQKYYYRQDNNHKLFFFLPFEHSEDLSVQELSVKLFKRFFKDNILDYAYRHYDIIKQFNRFPHRNDILNRPSSAEEIAFLKQPNAYF